MGSAVDGVLFYELSLSSGLHRNIGVSKNFLYLFQRGFLVPFDLETFWLFISTCSGTSRLDSAQYVDSSVSKSPCVVLTTRKNPPDRNVIDPSENPKKRLRIRVPSGLGLETILTGGRSLSLLPFPPSPCSPPDFCPCKHARSPPEQGGRHSRAREKAANHHRAVRSNHRRWIVTRLLAIRKK